MKTLFFPKVAWVRLPAVVLTLALSAASAFADDAIPKPFPPGHFDKLAAHSPFSPPTAAALATPPPPAPPGPKPFEKYTVVWLGQQGDQYVAGLNNKETSERIRVRTGEFNPEGIELVSVNWSEKPEQTRVTLTNKTQTGEVGFDPSAASIAPAIAPGLMPGVRPAIRPAVPAANTFHPPPGIAPSAPQLPVNNGRRPAVIRSGVAPQPIQPNPSIGAGQRPIRPAIPGAAPVAGGNDDDDDD